VDAIRIAALRNRGIEIFSQVGQETGAVQAKLQERILETTQRATAAEQSVEKLSKELAQARQDTSAAVERATKSEQSLRQLQEATSCRPEVAALAVCCEDLWLGDEAKEDEGARGDVTAKSATLLAALHARQVFCIGRVRMEAFSGIEPGTGKPLGPVPVSARVHVTNSGGEQWPQTVVMAIAGGDAMGLPVTSLPSLNPGETAEVAMDLSVPRRHKPIEASSTWTMLDAATGVPLGPLFTFDVEWY